MKEDIMIMTDKENNSLRKKQYEMHKSFFDRVKAAIENGFYLEAIFLEYAAIEGRIEIILGVLGCPCNKDIPDNERIKIKISHRITCLNKLWKNSPYFEKSKLHSDDFKKFEKWRVARNKFVHGLYKNGAEYISRTEDAKELAETGYDIAKQMYDEANRLKRILKKENLEHLDNNGSLCFAKKCKMYREEEICANTP